MLLSAIYVIRSYIFSPLSLTNFPTPMKVKSLMNQNVHVDVPLLCCSGLENSDISTSTNAVVLTERCISDREAEKAGRLERFRKHQEKMAAERSENGFIYRLEQEGAVICGYDKSVNGTLYIPQILGGQKVCKIEGSFNACKDLQCLVIPDFISEINATISEFCKSLEAFEVSSNNSHLCSQDGILFSKDMKQLIQYPQAKRGSYTVPQGVIAIRYTAFECCHGLISLTIPDSVTEIGFSAFAMCINLEQVVLPSHLKKIDSTLFSQCSSLVEIRMPNMLTDIENGAFDSCSSLTSVTFPSHLRKIGVNAFQGCASLKEIAIPSHTVNIEAGAFSNCEALTAINVDTGNPIYYSLDGVLFDHTKAMLIQYPAGRSGKYHVPLDTLAIMTSAFCGCARLTEILLPEGLANIGIQAFRCCSSLKRVSLPNTLQTIQDEAFIQCKNLCEVFVPASVTTVCHLAFAGCSRLERLIFESHAPYVMDTAFACSERVTIYHHKDTHGWDNVKGAAKVAINKLPECSISYLR